MGGGESCDDQAVPDGGSAAVELQDTLSPLGQDLAALTTRQVLLGALRPRVGALALLDGPGVIYRS